MNETTRAKALSALDGMREIVRREMLVQGVYVEEEISNPRLSGAICGGRKHCAIGSLWAGAGVKLNQDLELPGVEESDRHNFLRPRHGLRTAYDALNTAAEEFVEAHALDLDGGFSASIETLFESYYGDDLTKLDLLKIISAAKRKVKAA